MNPLYQESSGESTSLLPLLGVPDRMKWMEMDVMTTVTVVNGRRDFHTNSPSRGPSVILDEVRYGYLTMSGQLDAMIVLS